MKHPRHPGRQRLLAATALIGMTFVLADQSAAMNHPALPPQSTAAVAPSNSEPAWWRSFNDPLLDRLMQSVVDADDGFSQPGHTVRTVTHYLEAHWLTARLALAQDMAQVLEQRRRWAAEEGPTNTAAKATGELDRALGEINAQAQAIADRIDQDVAALRSISGYSANDDAELKQSLLTPSSMARFDLQRVALMPDPRVFQSLVQQAARVRQLDEVALDYAKRFEAQRKALDVGNSSERAALQAYEAMLLAADQALQAKGTLAMAWVRACAGVEGASSSP